MTSTRCNDISSPSALRDLNAAIEELNPFEGHARVTDGQIWRDSPDFCPLNQHATREIASALEGLRSPDRPVDSAVVLGDPGMGKSHFLRRVRQYQYRQNGFFIYVSAQQFSDSSSIRQQFLNILAASLRARTASGVLQWQVLAEQFAREALESIDANAAPTALKGLTQKLNSNALAKNQVWIDRLSQAFFTARPHTEDPDLVRAILWTLNNAQAPFAIKWLAGKFLAPWKLQELGLPPHPTEGRESLAWELSLQLLQLICDRAPLVIAFDRLENPSFSEPTIKKEQVTAGLVKYLRDRLLSSSCRYGALFLIAATPETWTKKLHPYTGQFTRCLTGDREPILLDASLDRPTISNVVSCWLSAYYERYHLQPPAPLYPFGSDQIAALEREQLNWQQIVQWCADNFSPVERDPLDSLHERFEEMLRDSPNNIDLENSHLLAEAVVVAFECFAGRERDGKAIAAVERVESDRKSAPRAGFQLQIRSDRPPITIKIMAIQSQHPRAVAAALKQLGKGNYRDDDRFCLLRSQCRDISPRWQCYQILEDLTAVGRGAWVDVTLEAIAPLLALAKLSESEEFSQASVAEFARSRPEIVNNVILDDILALAV